MRTDDDYLQTDSTFLRRIIILLVVITAVPVILWSTTTFVRSYVARPKVPTLHSLASAKVLATAPVAALVAPQDATPAAPTPPATTPVVEARIGANDAAGPSLDRKVSAPGAKDADPTVVGTIPSPEDASPRAGAPQPAPSAVAAIPAPQAPAWPEPAPSPAATAQSVAVPLDEDVPLPRPRPHKVAAAPAGAPLPRTRPGAAGPPAASAPAASDGAGSWLRNMFQTPANSGSPQ